MREIGLPRARVLSYAPRLRCLNGVSHRSPASLSPAKRNALPVSSRWADTPGNAKQATSCERERTYHPQTCLSRGAGCLETGLSGSTEARRSNASGNPAERPIPSFYPMANEPPGYGATGTCPGKNCRGRECRMGANLTRGGSRPARLHKPAGPFNPGRRGELVRGDAHDRDLDRPGVPRKYRTAKSSTMKGP